jgi:hypothetical protein
MNYELPVLHEFDEKDTNLSAFLFLFSNTDKTDFLACARDLNLCYL